MKIFQFACLKKGQVWRRGLIGLVCGVFCSFACYAAPSIIPLPNEMIVDETAPPFVITDTTQISVESGDASLLWVAEYLHGLLKGHLPGLPNVVAVDTGTAIESGTILLTTENADVTIGDAGYVLESHQDQVVIRAKDRTGLFWGVQTLRQLLPSENFCKTPAPGISWLLPEIWIRDWPAYEYRGHMNDFSRTFFPKKYVLHHIDLMALHKNNVFHLHLTDDQGWRIESKLYPKLNIIGSYWDKTVLPELAFGDGYYTQDDLKEIVEYAAMRNIEVIPEIDLPAHATALLKVFPELASNQPRSADEFIILPNDQSKIYHQEPLCPVGENRYALLDAIIGEIAAIFPSKYMHMGGDEVLKDQAWTDGAEVDALKKAEGLSNNHEVQAYFTKRIEGILESHEKTMITWNEANKASEKLPTALDRLRLKSDSVCMLWHHKSAVPELFNTGKVVFTPSNKLYYDVIPPNAPKRSYTFNPISFAEGIVGRALTPVEQNNIWGIQGTMWPYKEPFRNEKTVDQYIYPNHTATSEIAWTEPINKNYDDFMVRLEEHKKRIEIIMDDYYKQPTVLPGLAEDKE